MNVEAEFRRMQRVIDELQAEVARFRSKEIRTESDEEDRGVLSTDLPQTKKSRRMGPGAQPSLLALGGVAGDVHSDRPRRHSGEREWEPDHFFEAVIRDSRYGLQATRVGEAANPGPPICRVSNRGKMNANRFVVLSSDDEEEWVPTTLLVSSGAVRSAHHWDQVESPSVRVGIPPMARRSQHVDDVPRVERDVPVVVFPMTDDAVQSPSIPQRRQHGRRSGDSDQGRDIEGSATVPASTSALNKAGTHVLHSSAARRRRLLIIDGSHAHIREQRSGTEVAGVHSGQFPVLDGIQPICTLFKRTEAQRFLMPAASLRGSQTQTVCTACLMRSRNRQRAARLRTKRWRQRCSSGLQSGQFSKVWTGLIWRSSSPPVHA